MRVLKEEWKRLKQGKPGSRFRDLYEARRKQRRHPWSRVLFIAIGVVLVAVGAVAGLIPGPGGVVFVTVGVALIARELETAARVLDWCEPRLRRRWGRLRRWWARSGIFTRIAVVLAGGLVLGACGYLGYAWLY